MIKLATIGVLVSLALAPRTAAAYSGALASCSSLATNKAPFNTAANIPVFSADGYTRQSVNGPVADGMSQYVPTAKYPAQTLLPCGFIDPTLPPFNADPTGSADATAALNGALDAARTYGLVVYLPAGNYTVKDTVSCAEGLYQKSAVTVTSDHYSGACILIGARNTGARPTITLAPSSTGFADPSNPKPVLRFWSRSTNGSPLVHQQNVSMNQVISGLNVTIGTGNQGAIGIHHDAAQGSAVEDVTVDATYGYTGIKGLQSGGGGTFNVKVIGGVYGIDATGDADAPSIAGATLTGQTGSAIWYKASETLTLVGANITVPASSTGPAIKVDQGATTAFSLVDSVITFQGSGANTAISSAVSVYLNNVYVKNAKNLVNGVLAGNSTGWRWVMEYAHGVSPAGFQTPTFIDGVRKVGVDVQLLGTDGTAPPADLQSRHIWTESAFPSFDTASAINVKAAPYNAAGDASTDDYTAIQTAINDSPNGIIFLPKGYYRISKTLVLNSNTKLIGAAANTSTLIPTATFAGGTGTPSAPSPLIRTADDAFAKTVIYGLGGNPFLTHGDVSFVDWMAGHDSVLRQVLLERSKDGGGATVALNAPLILVEKNGGGRFYMIHYGITSGSGALFRLIKMSGTTQALRIYHVNPEHGDGETMVEVANASNVAIFGMKYETAYPAIWIHDSDLINVFGFGGLYGFNGIGDATTYCSTACTGQPSQYKAGYAQYTPSTVRVERTPNFRLANLFDRNAAAAGINPNQWYEVLERTGATAATDLFTPALDRPVLYRRGYATGAAATLAAPAAPAGFSVH